MKRIRDSKWYSYAMAACVAVAFYVFLMKLGTIWSALSTFIGYFKTVIFGCILAYIMNPLAKAYMKRPFGRIRSEKLRWTFSVVLSMLSVLMLLVILVELLVPQLIDSITTLADNYDEYASSLEAWLGNLGFASEDLKKLSVKILNYVSVWFTKNTTAIISSAAGVGKGLATWAIAFILSIYMLLAKESLKEGSERLLKALMPAQKCRQLFSFLTRCDSILVSYIANSLIECMIVGVINAVFMSLMGMQFVGLISVVVAITNLIPTFGPIIGGAVGAFILLLVNPMHALIFILFTLLLQLVDGYIVKPKLFGSSLGISGLFILIAVIVGGKMFGIVGMLIAIPVAAILTFIYKDYLLPWLERRRKQKQAGSADA